MISSLENNMKSFGNSFANTCISSLGQLPAPYLYGAILSIDKTSRRAFNFTMLISWLGILFICLTAYFRYKTVIKENDDNNDVDNSEKIKIEVEENKEIEIEINQNIELKVKINIIK
jgi:hypothetical protein